MADLSPQALRRTFGAYPTCIALIAATIDDRAVGMLANSFTSVSLDPPLVSINFDHASTTWPVLSRADRLGISLLGARDRDRALLLRRPTAERFSGIEMQAIGDGALALPDTAATLKVKRHSDLVAGDHVIVVFEVIDHARNTEAAPLVFHDGQMHALTD